MRFGVDSQAKVSYDTCRIKERTTEWVRGSERSEECAMSNLTLSLTEHVNMRGHVMTYYQMGRFENVPLDWYVAYDTNSLHEEGCESPEFDARFTFNTEAVWRTSDGQIYPAVQVEWDLQSPNRMSVPFHWFESSIGLRLPLNVIESEKYEEVGVADWMHPSGLHRNRKWLEFSTNHGMIVNAQTLFVEFRGSDSLESDLQFRIDTSKPVLKFRWVLFDPIAATRVTRAYTWKIQGTIFLVFRNVSWNEA